MVRVNNINLRNANYLYDASNLNKNLTLKENGLPINQDTINITVIEQQQIK